MNSTVQALQSNTSLNKADDPEKKVEVANTTLSRLMAGDFLESLGKELGLEVPPDPPYLSNIAVASASQKEVDNKPGNKKILLAEDSIIGRGKNIPG